MGEERRWTLINEEDYDFAYLAYDGPPIRAGERVEVVEAGPSQGQLTGDEWKTVAECALAFDERLDPDGYLAAKVLRSLAGGEG